MKRRSPTPSKKPKAGSTKNKPMEYKVVVEFDRETGHYTGTVAGLPNIVVDAKSEAATVKLAREAIRFYFDEEPATTPRRVRAKIVSVHV